MNMFVKDKIFKGLIFAFRILTNPKIINNYGVKVDVSSYPLKKYKKTFFMNSWESQEIRFLKDYLDKNDKVLEIGSCTGFLSIYCSKVLGSKNVVAVEANPSMLTVIESQKTLNNVSFKVVNGIVGNKTEYNFNILEDIFSSSLEKDNSRKKKMIIQGVSLEKLTQYFKPTFLILDIEGGEYDVLLENDMPSSIRKILVEFHGIKKHSGLEDEKFNDVINLLKSLEFKYTRNVGRVFMFKR